MTFLIVDEAHAYTSTPRTIKVIHSHNNTLNTMVRRLLHLYGIKRGRYMYVMIRLNVLEMATYHDISLAAAKKSSDLDRTMSVIMPYDPKCAYRDTFNVYAALDISSRVNIHDHYGKNLLPVYVRSCSSQVKQRSQLANGVKKSRCTIS